MGVHYKIIKNSLQWKAGHKSVKFPVLRVKKWKDYWGLTCKLLNLLLFLWHNRDKASIDQCSKPWLGIFEKAIEREKRQN